MTTHPTASDTVATRNAREAIARLTPKFLGLIRSIRDPSVHAIGDWTIGDVAAHVSHVADIDLIAALGKGADLPEVHEITDVPPMNAAALVRDRERDTTVLADRIEELAEYLLDVHGDENQLYEWLFGAQLPISAIFGHFVSEVLIHGRDIAEATRLPWRIDGEDARIALANFYPVIVSEVGFGRRGCDVPRASCEIRIRGGGGWMFVQTDRGVVAEPPGRRVDLHISADPVTMLLLMSGRIHRREAARRGMVAWGRRPLRAMRMLEGMRAP